MIARGHETRAAAVGLANADLFFAFLRKNGARQALVLSAPFE